MYRWNFVLEGSLQAVGVSFIAYNQRDFDAWQFLAFNGIDECLQVAA